MSLYYEGADILNNPTIGSFKSQVYGNKNRKSNPATLFALVAQTSKWSAVLSEVVEKSGLLNEEKKLTPALAVLLTHDLILSKGGVAAPANHVLKLAVTRHKARLNAEFTKLRLRQGFGTVDAFRAHIETASLAAKSNGGTPHPRWIRINALRSTLEEQLKTTFAGYEHKEALEDVCVAQGSDKVLRIDPNIPDLVAVPPLADFTRSKAYLNGQLILQDKASCFPAYLLAHDASNTTIIDATSAPGNKTTHLASCLWKNRRNDGEVGQVLAYEKDEKRTRTLQKMVKIAAANCISIRAPHDFMETDPLSKEMSRVTALLLDPSCSGSGIVGRDDTVTVTLPSTNAAGQQAPRGKKRKRNAGKEKEPSISNSKSTPNGNGITFITAKVGEEAAEDQEQPADETESGSSLKERLEALASFQLRMVTHAMQFPAARRISYSTCSIHWQENEGVVFRALSSDVAKSQGWRIQRVDEQPKGLQKWPVRGAKAAELEGELSRLRKTEGWTDKMIDEVCRSVIRCEKGTEQGTMGFFVAGFVRDGDVNSVDTNLQKDTTTSEQNQDDDEWNGFSSDDD